VGFVFDPRSQGSVRCSIRSAAVLCTSDSDAGLLATIPSGLQREAGERHRELGGEDHPARVRVAQFRVEVQELASVVDGDRRTARRAADE
jgi:hypothetical protein